MDKFVIREQSWKTMSYEQLNATKGRLSLGGKSNLNNSPALTKMPMKENQNANILLGLKTNRRLSVLDERLIQIISMPADEPLTPSGDSKHVACFNRGGTPKTPDNINFDNNENQRIVNFNHNNNNNNNNYSTPQAIRTTQSKASDYLSSSESHRFSVSEATNDGNVPFEKLLYGEENNVHSPFKLQRINNTNNGNIILDRIQMDLNSPSASVRLRAMKALKDSQSYAAYTKLDVPHAEQSIITEEDRRTPPPPPTIQDVMRSVVAYVELRYGEDNRTAGIKQHLLALGAQVNDKLLRNTTHVIFNEGLLSTYKKAKNWDIPIVSILWVNACETQLRLCDPKDFPISDADRYENPELYEKFKRVKCIHPDSELNKRVRPKPSTPKEAATPKRATTPKPKRISPNKLKSSSAKGKGKTDISQYFKTQVTKLDSEGNVLTPETPQLYQDDLLKNRIEVNSVQTPITSLSKQMKQVALHDVGIKTSRATKKTTNNNNNNNDGGDDVVIVVEAKTKDGASANELNGNKTEDNGGGGGVCVGSVVSARGDSVIRNDSSRVGAGHDSANQNQKESDAGGLMPTSLNANKNDTQVPSVRYMTRRLSSVYASENKMLASSIRNTTASKVNKKQSQQQQSKQQSSNEEQQQKQVQEQKDPTLKTSSQTNTTTELINKNMSLETTPSNRRSTRVRRTTLTCRTIDLTSISSNKEDHIHKSDNSNKNIPNKTIMPAGRNRRRTLFTPQKMELTLEDLDQEEATENQNKIVNTSNLSMVTCNDQSWSNLVSSTIMEKPKYETPDDSKTLLEEQAETLVFSSTREPKSRKTLFDIGMDIIDQRMQNINRSARRSILSKSADVLARPLLDPSHDQHDVHKSNTTPSVNKKSPKGSTTTTTPPAVHGIKKRKLFVPNDSLTQELTPTQNLNVISSGSVTKRRRNLKTSSDDKQSSLSPSPSSAIKKDKASKMAARSERNSNGEVEIDVEAEAKTKINSGLSPPPRVSIAIDPKEIEENSESFNNKSANSNHSNTNNTNSNNNNNNSNSNNTDNSNNNNNNNFAKRRPTRRSTMLFEKSEKTWRAQQTAQKALARDTRKVLVYTNMHVEQINSIREALTFLGGFRLDYAVNNTTTHLVSLEPRRTLNMLRALIRGLWILDFQWILDSHKAGKWLPEEQYEMNSFSRAVEICRTERQAFKEYYQCDLFRDLEPFYISSECEPLSKVNLKELIKSCGGQVHDHRSTAKYIIASKHKGGGHSDSLYVTPFWILDSITQMQLLPYQKYTLPRCIPRKIQKPYMAESPYKTHADVMKALQLSHLY